MDKIKLSFCLSLNIHTLKHYLATDLKKNRNEDQEEDYYINESKPNEILNLRRITVKNLVSLKSKHFNIELAQFKISCIQ